MRTGIYGGTFSPPHIGHISAARAFAEQMELDELLIIPALLPPHKTIDYEDHPEKRFRMCELAFGDIKCAEVSDIELRREGKSYTVDTLKALSAEGRELFLLCGTDMILTLGSWFAAEEIFARCTPVGIRRESDPENTELIKKKLLEYKEKFSVDVKFINAETIEISSSELRLMIENGECTERYLTREIEEYIKTRRLYTEA